MARARFQDPVDIKIKVNDGRQEVFHVPNAGETVMQQIIFGPGGRAAGTPTRAPPSSSSSQVC